MCNRKRVIILEQLSLFDFNFQADVDIFFLNGAMYAKANKEEISAVPIELGDKVLTPGQFVSKLGEKKRTSFEMQEGFYLRYVGKAGDYILFSVNDEESDYYYAFGYVNKNILMIVNNGAGRDIRLEKLEVYESYDEKCDRKRVIKLSNVIKELVRIARRNYHCDDCEQLITKGSKYHYLFGSDHKSEKPYSIRICQKCKPI